MKGDEVRTKRGAPGSQLPSAPLALQAQMEATHIDRQKRQEQLLVEYLRDREPLLQRR